MRPLYRITLFSIYVLFAILTIYRGGSRGKIFNVHFRNIKGGFLNFQETFPDNGDVDFLRAIRTYKEVGYEGMLMPDHVPKIDGYAGGKQAFAYCFGYIQALLQMVNEEG